MEGIRRIVGNDELITNETGLFVGEDGVRTVNNANEVAHYEYGAVLASNSILEAMDLIDIDVSELELGDVLQRHGQHTTITTIASSGERFVKGNMFPADRKVKSGDPVSLTVGYMGGSSSRAAYAVKEASELPDGAQNYLDELAKPYFNAYVTWMEKIYVGMKGYEMYQTIEDVLPKADYHWSLCPGHLIAEEEWLCSPIYENSQEILRSGMMFQIDMIPSRPNMAGVSAESTVLLADEKLKNEIQIQYPDLWERMQKRIAYLKNELHIDLSDDLLPMCSTVAYLHPYLLNKDHAFVVEA